MNSTHAVNIDDFAFVPTTLTVKAGSTVAWTNNDEDPHTVVADGGAVRSRALGSGGTYAIHPPGRGRLRRLDPPVHARQRRGDTVTEDCGSSPMAMSRRQLIRHGAWFGAAVGLAVVGGEVISHVAGSTTAAGTRPTLRFAQVGDSHIGFTGPANTDVTGSFTRAIDQINGLGYTPGLVIHTGDLTHLATPAQFDQVKQMLTDLSTPHVFTVSGEHDSVDDAGQKYRNAFGAGTRGDGWYSFDIAGVHVIAPVNTCT